MIEPEIKAQEAGDMSAAHAAPRPTGNRDRSDMGYGTFGPASDREREVACPEIAARTRREWGEIFAVGDPEHRHVRRRIAPRQRRPEAPPIRNRDRDVLIGVQGFLGGDDGAATPDKAAKGGAVPPVDRHNARPDGGDVARELIGQKRQRISRGLLGHDTLATEQARSLDLTGGIATWPDG